MDEELFGGREALAEPTARWSMGGLFIEALARRDFAAMADCLDAGVRLRALLPSGPVQLTGRDVVVERFRRWFGRSSDELELVDGTVGEVGSRLYLRWRVSLTPRAPAGQRRLVEQHLFATTAERISNLDLLCSGFVSEPTKFVSDKGEVPCLERR